MPVLRPYQQRVISEIRAIWANGTPRVIGVLPTGAGKSVIASVLREGFSNPLSICNTNLLCEQLNETVCRATTWQALRHHREWPNGVPDFVVVDEVHVADSPDWQQVFPMIPSGVPVLGLTATPWRFTHGTDPKRRKKNAKYGKGLGDLFGAMVIGVTPRQLVNDKYLVPLRVYDLVAEQDAEAIARRKKDRTAPPGPSWNERQQKHTGRITSNSAVRLDIYDAWAARGEGRKTMVFCHLIPAAERAAERFREHGVPSAVVHGKLGKKECAKRLAAFKRGEYQVLINVMMLTAGVDVPDVSCIVLDRGANTLNTYIQICGRGARTAPGKEDCIVLDLSGCSSEHGDPQADQDYWISTCEGRQGATKFCINCRHCGDQLDVEASGGPVEGGPCRGHKGDAVEGEPAQGTHEVCGAGLSPMFPTRCMRCDPFHPKVGDPQALLDTGCRIYTILQELGTRPTDDAIVAALSTFEPATEREAEVLADERGAAERRIEAAREATRAEAERVARVAAAQAAAEAARVAREAAEADWRKQLVARQEAERTALEAKQAARAAALAQQARDSEGLLSPAELHEFRTVVARHVTNAMRSKWSISYAVRGARDQLTRYRGKYERENYTVPPELQWVLTRFAKANPAWVKYELDRMLADPKTSKYGPAWCRKKVRQLFGTLEGADQAE